MFRRVGVRGRLLSAFMGVSSFALIAVATAIYSFSEVGTVLTRVTEERVPAALDFLDLSRMAERIVAAAPKLLAVSNATQQAEVSAEIADQVGQLERLYKHLRHSDMDGLDDIGDDIARISLNLSRLDTSVASHLALEQERRTIVSEVLKSAQIARTGSKPGRVLIESRLAEWRRSFADPEPLWLIIGSADLSAALDSLLPLQRAELVIATLASMTHSVAAADDHANLAGLVAPLEHSLEQLREHVANFPESMRSRAEHQLATFEDGLMGEGGLVVVRGLELQALQEAQAVLDDNARISEHLTLATDQLISDAGRVISASAADAASIHDFSSRVLIAVALLSIISSGLIVMLYVDRNLLHRLSALSGSMLAVADGNLRVRLPPADGGDEIAEMARALTVFRDTAVEIEDKGLREIDRARQRLIDAIESISEGFAFYGRDDRLELCNSRCVELLYGGTGIKIDPGTTFEAMIRRAVESGLIREAVGSPEHYIRLRLAQHRNPGSPILQQRADGRWIVIAERKVSGGGTVAVYSDITELKCRELELEEAKGRTEESAEEIGRKHRELEAVSSRLAKYLSPQVYASIFTGKQEVQLASQRKKLTVFFSDIVGFTEITERLESEELTQLLNHYLTEMTRIATEHGATVDKYVGDAIMCFFGDPETRGVKQDALACVKMALAMQARLGDLSTIWRDAGIEQPLRCRIGIHTGYCTVGNFGSEDRMDYTIHGSTVNLASRLEHEAPASRIFISYETYAHVKDEVSCEDLGLIRVRGIGHPVATYRVLELKTAGRSTRIRSCLPHLKLDADPEAMSADERRRAADALQAALNRVHARTW